MVKISRTVLRQMLLTLLLCSCNLPDKEERDWNRIRSFATEYGLRKVTDEIKMHLITYPQCRHRGAAEDYFVHSCRERNYLGDFCSDYVETFPNGARMAEVEEIFWHECQRSSINCFDYAKKFPNSARTAEAEEVLWLECEKGSCWWYTKAFPNGKHIADARAREEVSKQGQAEKRKFEAKLKQKIWNGPKIDAYLELPYSADPIRINVKLLGDDVIPVGYRYQLPQAFPTVDVCYDNGSWHKNDDNCARMTLASGNNRVPLSRLRITAPKEFKLWCRIESEGHTLSVEGTVDTNLFFMSGTTHLLSCDLMGYEYHGEFSSGFSSASDVKVTFKASDVPGFIDVVYVINGAHVSAFVMPN